MTTVPDLSGNTAGVDAEFAPERDGTPAYPFSVLTGGTGLTALAVQGADTINTAVLGKPVVGGGVFYTAGQPVTLTNGQVGQLQITSKGFLLGAVATKLVSADGITNNLAVLNSSDTGVYPGIVATIAWNGTTFDRTRKPNAVKRVASSAASGSPDFAKASAGDVTKISGLNTTAAIIYFHLYNKASAPTIGTDTPAFSYAINANERFDISIQNGGLYLGTGIAYAFTTDIATVPTTGAAAAAVTAFALAYA